MKICNYCGTGMDNQVQKCPFCGQDMTIRGAIKYEDNLPFNGSLDVYSTKHLRKDPAVEDKKNWFATLSAKKAQYENSTGKNKKQTSAEKQDSAQKSAAYAEGKRMQEKYAASQQKRQIQNPRPKRKSKKSAKRSRIFAAVIVFFVVISTMMGVCDETPDLDLDSPFLYNNEIMYSGSVTESVYSNTEYMVAISLSSDWTMSVPNLPSQDALCFTDLEGNNADSTIQVTYVAESVDSIYDSDYEADGSPAVYDNANSYLVSQKAELDATGIYATMEVETAQLDGKTAYLLHYSNTDQYFVQVAAETNVAGVYVVIECSSSNFYAINELLSHISFAD